MPHTSGLALPGFSASRTTSGVQLTVLAMVFFTRSLQVLPAVTVDDVIRIIQTTSKTPTSKKDKGFKLFVSSYINNYEGKLTVHQTDSDTC